MAEFLCCRPLVLISRLSYALYLCQFIVFLTHAGTVRTSAQFSMISLIDFREISGILISSIILTLTFIIPMQSLHKIFTFSPKKEEQEEKSETEGENLPDKIEEPVAENQETEDQEMEETEVIEIPQTRSRHFMAHREVLEEIPEVEVEYETQREKNEGLEEILEEEEDEADEEEMENHLDDDDLEIIEEEQEQEQGGEDDFWAGREDYTPRREYPRQDDEDIDEWEWTANGNGRNGAQYFRYTR